MAKGKTPRRKHIPIRTCIACRQTNSKRELIRVVRTTSGEVRIDPTGKVAGRGAYLCKARPCWEQALKGSKLNVALKTTLTTEELATLQQYAATLPEITVSISETRGDGAAQSA